MNGLVNACIGCLLIVAWAYGRLSHARGLLPISLRAFRPRQRPSRSTTNKQPTYTFNQPCIQPSIHLSNHPSVHSPTHPFPHPSIHPPTHPPTHSSIHPFFHPHPSILSIHSFILATLHPPIRPFTRMQPHRAYTLHLNPYHSPKAESSPSTTGIGYTYKNTM